MMNNESLLRVSNLNKTFTVSGGFLKKKLVNRVINNVSLEIKAKRTYGLVGESGSGKSTLARLIVGLTKKNSGKIIFKGNDLDLCKDKNLKNKLQMVFQNPMESLNPRMKIFNILKESMFLSGFNCQENIEKRIYKIIEEVGLSKSDLLKYPSSFSGGQAQRIAIARCLLSNPDLIILDESVSALDVSIQAQILNLLVDLQKNKLCSYLFISHDLNVTRYISDTIGVMYLGKIVEEGDTDLVFSYPLHPYTKMLLASVSGRNANSEIIGEIPSQFVERKGCAFYPRCPYRIDKCLEIEPNEKIVKSRKISCHLY